MKILDRIVIRALLKGHIEFSDTLSDRFAKLGKVTLYRPISSGRWSLLLGHDAADYDIPLGWVAHNTMQVVCKYRTLLTRKVK